MAQTFTQNYSKNGFKNVPRSVHKHPENDPIESPRNGLEMRPHCPLGWLQKAYQVPNLPDLAVTDLRAGL